jgi:hypothetical protein
LCEYAKAQLPDYEPEDEETADELLYGSSFNYPPALVLRCTMALKQFNVLPAAGGLLDQDEQLWNDMDTMTRLMNRARREVKAGNVMDSFSKRDDGVSLDFGWGS